MLLASIILPHHHHRDGSPCYYSITKEMQKEHGEHHSDTSDCGCNGHNLAFFACGSHSDNHTLQLHLMPLMCAFIEADLIPDYFSLQRSDKENVYHESLHSISQGGAVVLRAPPVC